ncbi:histidine kinase [Anaerocolumna sp. AGMB13025]|uniref:sensor histidine kinase n=1 Tax=Anaerocolumna sp. AGMB13025 TaxID=3039116 RepID=UPI00241CC5EB|nr:histidine kinase [Anaerocolumna sp. AGMB13025]WFR56563.1 histidine kinase [Anaerocolumna sp. AGMB13025]
MKKPVMHFVKPKVRQQIILICMFSTFIPLFIVGLFSIMQARKQMSEQYESQVSTAALRINSTIFDITTSLYTSCDNLINSNYLRKLLGSDFSTTNDRQYYKLATDSLTTMRSTTAAIASIMIYTNNPNIPSNSYITTVNNYSGLQWSDQIAKNALNSWKCLTSEDSWHSKVYELSIIRRIGINSTKYSAYLVLSIDANYLKNRLLDSEYTVMASVDNELTFYSSERNWLQKLIPFPSEFDNNYYKYTGPLVIDSKKQLANIVTFLPYKTYNKFYICVTDPNAYARLNRITLIYVVILITVTLFPIILTILYSSYFNTRVQTLKNAMHQVSLGDYNIMKLFKGDDELTEIFKDLKSTVQKISENEALFYQSQIVEQQLINKQQQMEYKMLANQINPHFLYNTLETIRMQALSTGNKDVITSIKLLGKSMHYVLENTGTDSTTLAKELEYVEVYLSIQKIRFGDRVNYTINYYEDMDLNNYKILPLLLQPIVENAVIHGLERNKVNGQIIINISKTANNMLIIKITDNGNGMNAVQLKELNKRINSASLDTTSSIGLYNINQRIKLLYGAEYGITFASQLNEGTTVTLIIPAITVKEA